MVGHGVKLRGILVVAALVVGLAVAACGDGDGDGDASGEGGAIAEADAVCADANDDDVPQISNFETDPARTASILAEKIDVAEQEQAGIEAIDPPEEVAAQWQQFLDLNAERLTFGEQQQRAIEDGDAEAMKASFEKSHEIGVKQTELAEEIGFEVCGLGRYAGTEPEPAVSLEQRLTELGDAIAGKDCDTLTAITGTELIVPEQQQDAFCKALYADLEGFDPEQAEVDDWETAAVIENEKPDGSVIAQPLLLDGDETFRIATVFQDQHAVGTEPEPDAEFEQVAERTVDAIRDDDCEALAETYDPDSFASPDAACEAFSFRLDSALEQDPDLAPELLGADAWFAAFALRTQQGSYLTMLVSRKDDNDRSAEQGGDYRVSAIAAPFR